MKKITMSLLLAMAMAWPAAHAATDNQPPILKSQPKVGDAMKPVHNPCGPGWRRGQPSNSTRTTCVRDPNASPAVLACKTYSSGDRPPADECAVRVEAARSPTEQRQYQLCKPWLAEVKCAAGWEGPMTGSAVACTAYCQVPPK